MGPYRFAGVCQSLLNALAASVPSSTNQNDCHMTPNQCPGRDTAFPTPINILITIINRSGNFITYLRKAPPAYEEGAGAVACYVLPAS